MRDLLSVGIIGQAYNDMKYFRDMDASKTNQNYVKYATSKKASLKRKQKGKRNK